MYRENRGEKYLHVKGRREAIRDRAESRKVTEEPAQCRVTGIKRGKGLELGTPR